MEERQDRQTTRNEHVTGGKAYSTSSVPPVDLCAFPPPFFDLFPSKSSWITPAIHMPMPVWDDNLLDAFDLTLDDVEQAIRQRETTKPSMVSVDNPPKSSTIHSDSNNIDSSPTVKSSILSVTSESSLNNASAKSSPSSDSDIATLTKLIKLACDNPLNNQQFLQLNSIVSKLSNDVIGQSIQLDTREWHNLMEFNSRSAIVLLKAVLSNPVCITADTDETNSIDTDSVEAATLRLIYLDILASAPFTLRTAEIILELARQHRLDSDFTASYLSGCMDACNRQTNHESAQRTARLICVLLRSLIQDQFFGLNSSELIHFRVEWQSFCLQYSKEKEAAAMYQLLTKNGT